MLQSYRIERTIIGVGASSFMFKGKNVIYLYTALFWLKLYIVQRNFFAIPVNGMLDEVMIIIGTISSAALLSAVILLCSRKRMHLAFFIASAIGSALVISNVIYFRFFHDFMTIAVLTQTGNASTLKHSLFTQLHFPADLLIFIDTIIIGYIFFKKNPKFSLRGLPKVKKIVGLFVVFFVCVSLNFAAAHDGYDEKSASSIHTDNVDLVKHAGIYNYQLYDLGSFVHLKTVKWFADRDDFTEVEEQLEAWHPAVTSDYFGLAEGKNVIFISLESVQTFALETDIAGREVTPFLNELLADSWYFSDFYHQTAHGKTSDAEFMVETSLYPLDSSAVFFNYANNTFQTLTKELQAIDYTSVVFHANEATFWNRDKMYDTIGYDHFFDIESFNETEENSIGWGLNDEALFAQSMPLVRELPQPFMAKWITLTNHHPFESGLYEDWTAQIPTDNDVVSGYFSTVHYTDKAVEHFFELMKDAGLYEDSIFILYGDHYGIAPIHYDDLSDVLQKPIDELEHVLLQQVPLIIHVPGEEPFRDERTAGQIDIKPTVKHLLGIERTSETIEFGYPLVAEERPAFAVLRNGTLITDDYIFVKEHCYDRATSAQVNPELCEPYTDLARAHLNLSDELIYGDLLRFLEEEE